MSVLIVMSVLRDSDVFVLRDSYVFVLRDSYVCA